MKDKNDNNTDSDKAQYIYVISQIRQIILDSSSPKNQICHGSLDINFSTLRMGVLSYREFLIRNLFQNFQSVDSSYGNSLRDQKLKRFYSFFLSKSFEFLTCPGMQILNHHFRCKKDSGVFWWYKTETLARNELTVLKKKRKMTALCIDLSPVKVFKVPGHFALMHLR